MRNSWFKIVLVTLGALCFFGSCEKSLDLKIREQGGQLVLFSFITPDSLFKVHVSKSVSHLSVNDFERVYDSRVSVYQNEVRVDSFIFPFDQLWAARPDIKPQQGDRFRIIVTDGNGMSAEGETIVPIAVPIAGKDTMTQVFTATDGARRTMLRCTLNIPDPDEQDNYYQLYLLEKTCVQKEDGVDCVKQWVDFASDDNVFYFRDQEGSLLGGIDFEGSFSDFLFQGETYPLEIKIPILYTAKPPPGTQRTLYFLLVSHTSDYFNYFRSRVVAEYGYDLPIIDPIKIFYNVKGGLGLVGGVSIAKDSLVFSGDSL